MKKLQYSYPMELRPCYRGCLWGGTRLESLYGKKSGLPLTGESWELSCRPGWESTVCNGPYAGAKLPEVLGAVAEFPVLVKFIDARRCLSVQVHPSDENADRSRGEQGKAEMWYVVDCRSDSYLYYGLSRAVSREELRAAAEEGSNEQCLNRVRCVPGDVFFLPPGMIHALGPGMLVAEVQQNSDTTFRLFDFGRLGADGKPRELHLERGCAVAGRTPTLPRSSQGRIQAGFSGYTLTELFSCRYFNTWRLDAETARLRTGDRFAHLLFIRGQGVLRWQGGSRPFRAGSSWFLPADMGEYMVEGACRALLTRA